MVPLDHLEFCPVCKRERLKLPPGSRTTPVMFKHSEVRNTG